MYVEHLFLPSPKIAEPYYYTYVSYLFYFLKKKLYCTYYHVNFTVFVLNDRFNKRLETKHLFHFSILSLK